MLNVQALRLLLQAQVQTIAIHIPSVLGTSRPREHRTFRSDSAQLVKAMVLAALLIHQHPPMDYEEH